MKFFHLSDLHIGLKLMNRDLAEDQEEIFRQITEAARLEQPDAILIAGDIYDRAIPSQEAVSLFDRFVLELTDAVPSAEIMMISGNHDSGPRVNLYRNVLEKQRIHMIGMPPQEEGEQIEQVTLKDEYGPVHFYLLPFVRPSAVKRIVGTDENGNNLSYSETLSRLLAREEINTGERNVLVSHQFYLPKGANPGDVERMDSEIRTVGDIDEVDAEVLEPFDYAALGHIHKPMAVGKPNYRYCGTPLQCSVSEAGQEKGIVSVVFSEKGTVESHVIPLHPLREVRVVRGLLAEVLNRPSQDYVSVILTDPEDLDVIDMQDQLRAAFPNLLNIRRETLWEARYEQDFGETEMPDPFDLCCAFLNNPDDRDRALLRDVFNSVTEGRR